jgi:hypothetical protein
MQPNVGSFSVARPWRCHNYSLKRTAASRLGVNSTSSRQRPLSSTVSTRVRTRKPAGFHSRDRTAGRAALAHFPIFSALLGYSRRALLLAWQRRECGYCRSGFCFSRLRLGAGAHLPPGWSFGAPQALYGLVGHIGPWRLHCRRRPALKHLAALRAVHSCVGLSPRFRRLLARFAAVGSSRSPLRRGLPLRKGFRVMGANYSLKRTAANRLGVD